MFSSKYRSGIVKVKCDYSQDFEEGIIVTLSPSLSRLRAKARRISQPLELVDDAAQWERPRRRTVVVRTCFSPPLVATLT